MAEPAPAAAGATTWKTGLGVVLFLSAIVGVSASLQAVVWQVKNRLYYTPGQCRVAEARIQQVGQSHQLYIEHQVLIDGHAFRPTRNTDRWSPSYSRREDAEETLAKFPVGSLHPCYYDAADPERHSVLIYRENNLLVQSLVLVVSLVWGAVGALLVLRSGPAAAAAAPAKKQRRRRK